MEARAAADAVEEYDGDRGAEDEQDDTDRVLSLEHRLTLAGLTGDDLAGDGQDVGGGVTFGAAGRTADAVHDRPLLRVEHRQRRPVRDERRPRGHRAAEDGGARRGRERGDEPRGDEGRGLRQPREAGASRSRAVDRGAASGSSLANLAERHGVHLERELHGGPTAAGRFSQARAELRGGRRAHGSHVRRRQRWV